MNLQAQIQQQQATVQMLEKLRRANRCAQSDVDQAKRRLDELQEQVNFRPLAPRQDDPPEGALAAYVPAGPRIEGDDYMQAQADLSKQADQLNRKMVELSNKLHLVPPGVNCPELVKPILELKAQIEAIWDKKRYLERNKALPAEDPAPVSDRQPAPDVPEGKYALAYEKRRLVDLRSKLKRKLEDPKAKPSKRTEWEIELAQATLRIADLDVQLEAL